MATNTGYIDYNEGAAPSTPAANKTRLYAKSDGLLYSKDDAGTETLVSGGTGGGAVATDAIWDAAGDLAVGSGANTAAKLSIGATNGMALRRVSGAVAWDLPPGHEFDYVAFTSPVSVTATSEATANTIVTASAVTFDGSTAVIIEFFCPQVAPQATNGVSANFYLYDGSSSIGIIGQLTNNATQTWRFPTRIAVRITPAAATKTYSIRGSTGSGTATMGAGAGGAAALYPGFIRITKA